MKSSPRSVVSPISPQAAAAPSTPNKPIRQILVDSEDRAKRRKFESESKKNKAEENINTLDYKSIDEFRKQIKDAYEDCFSKFCDTSKMTDDFLWNEFDSYADSGASILTDDGFDPADLSIILLAIKHGLPIFVDNPSMKKQIHKSSRILAKDAQIVSFSDLDASNLTRDGILKHCAGLDMKHLWGISANEVLGIADTGFISALSNHGIIDQTLEDAFISPEFVEKELTRETAKLTMQSRSITTADIEQQVSEDLKVLGFISKSNLEKDMLQLAAQPVPNENILLAFPSLKAAINLKLNSICPKTAGNMIILIKKCITYRSVMENYDYSEFEINYLYAVYQIISGDAAVTRNQFVCEDFLATITTVEGLDSAIDSFIIANSRTITSLKGLDLPLKAMRSAKSAGIYKDNKIIKEMTVSCNEAFGPLYNVHRSLVKKKINLADSLELHMVFYYHLFELLDGDAFDSYKKNNKVKNVANKSLKALPGQLSEIFEKIDAAISNIRKNVATNNITAKFDDIALSERADCNLNPPASSSSSLAITPHDPKSSLSSCSFGHDITNTPPLVNVNKNSLSPSKENRSAIDISST